MFINHIISPTYNTYKRLKKFSFVLIMEETNMRRFNRGGFRNNSEPREMHKATCAECGEECEVPFKPTEGKSVYCRECYRKKRRF